MNTIGITAVDLFAGWGGFTEGAELAGARVAWAANHWPLAVEAHQRNHPHAEHVCQDLRQADWTQLPAHDILLASPACQGHSPASQPKRRAFHDALRATAWSVVDCVEVCRPRALLVENVPTFQSWELYPVWIEALSKLGYNLTPTIAHPASEDVLAKLPCDRLEGVELGRFVLLDDVPGNGESWFLARCMEILRARGYRALISHSDPVPRRAIGGELVLPGHVGFIYQATSYSGANAVYGGRSKPTLHVLMPTGQIFSPRAMTKIRSAERGYLNDIDKLVQIGAERPTAADLASRDSRRAWMWREIFRTCRRMPHDGNHRYLWAIDKRLRRDIERLAATELLDDSFEGPPARARYPKKCDSDPVLSDLSPSRRQTGCERNATKAPAQAARRRRNHG